MSNEPRNPDRAARGEGLSGVTIQPASHGIQPALAGQLRDELTEAGVPGGAAAISWDGQILTAAHGVASTRTRVPVTDGTLFKVGSISKSFLAAAILKLSEQGVVALEDPIRRHLPGFRLHDDAAAEAVTILDLITHRGGWQGDFVDDTGQGDEALASYVQRMVSLPQLAQPGSTFSYSNAGYDVLGHLLERKLGCTFEAALTQLVLEPLGIEACFSAADAISRWFAVGHQADLSVLDFWELPRCARPSGGVIATPAALVRFGAALAAPGDVLSPHARELMLTPRTDAVGTENLGDSFGLGWFLREIEGTTIASHAGDVLGQHALLVAVPSARFAIALAVNSPIGEPAAERVACWALRECVGLDPTPTLARDAPASARHGLAGRYESSLHLIEVASERDDSSRLTLEPKPLIPDWPVDPPFSSKIRLLEDDTIVFVDPPLAGSRARVVRNADGTVTHLRVVGRLAAATDPLPDQTEERAAIGTPDTPV